MLFMSNTLKRPITWNSRLRKATSQVTSKKEKEKKKPVYPLLGFVEHVLMKSENPLYMIELFPLGDFHTPK